MKDCLADAELRKTRRKREVIRRTELDQKYLAEFASHIQRLFPGCPAAKETEIAEHACRKYSGRVGRSRRAKEFALQAITLAVQAYVRHEYTNYNELLMMGQERFLARDMVRDQVEEVLVRWQRKWKK